MLTCRGVPAGFVTTCRALDGRLVGTHAVASADGRRSVSRREWRVMAATALSLIGIAEVILLAFSAHGPLGGIGGIGSAKASVGGVVVDVLGIGLILDALRKGRRWAWWCGWCSAG